MTSLELFTKDFKDKNILVLGLGVLGGGAKLVNFLHKVGGNISIADLKTKQELNSTIEKIIPKDIKFFLGNHNPDDLKEVDIIIRNPAIPQNHPILIFAKDNKIPIYMEAALYAKYTNKPIIGVTGTRGKTTTTLLIHHILNSTQDKKVELAGNIPGKCALSLLDSEHQKDHWGTILELSSWQLQGFDDFKISPQIAVLTNIYPDHLNRYQSMDDYIKDKEVITKYQKIDDNFIFNGGNELVRKISSTSSATTIDFSTLSLPENSDHNLLGSHNIENIKASITVAKTLGVPENEIFKSIKSFHPVPFRLEPIKTINQVTYINDTTSTTPVSLQAAISSIKSPTILIMGGNSKGLPLEDLEKFIKTRTNIKKIILIPGSGTDEIIGKLENFTQTNNLKDAIIKAREISSPGDTVLFSPGFTSFSQFKNEFDRGDYFNQVVNQI